MHLYEVYTYTRYTTVRLYAACAWYCIYLAHATAHKVYTSPREILRTLNYTNIGGSWLGCATGVPEVRGKEQGVSGPTVVTIPSPLCSV